MEETIAVCIMTHNRKELLEKAVNSVLNSSYQNFQLIIFNDNSTDGTSEYIDSIKNNKIIEIRHPSNLGQFDNANFLLNYVIKKSDYNYFLLLHDDDTVHPYLIEKKINMMLKDEDISIVGSAWNRIDESNKVLGTSVYSKLDQPIILSDKEYFLHHFCGLNFPWTGILYRKSKVGDIRPNNYFSQAADVVFLSDLAIGNKIGYIPEAIYNYRIHEVQISSIRDDLRVDYELWKKIFDYYRNLTKNKFKERTYKTKLKKAINETIFASILKSPDFSFYFYLLRSEYLTLYYLSPVRYLKILNKFMKLLYTYSKNL